MKKISVCMASYNGEKYIKNQLESILSQIGEGDEVIISDDWSIDNTVRIINQFNDKRVRIYLNNNRPGPVGNFEHALSKATGDHIILSDQDDIWEPNKVDTVCSLLNNFDLVLSNCQVINEMGVILHNSFFEFRGSQPGFWHNLYKNSYMGCCMSFRREVLSYVLPIPPQVHMHDWWIGLLVELKGKVCFYPHPLIKYVRHGSNLSPTGEVGYGPVKRFTHRFTLLINLINRLLK